MKINHRHYVLIFLALFSVAVSVGSYVLLYRHAIFQAEHYVNANKELEDEDNKRQSDQGLVKTYEASKDSRAKITTFLIKEDKIVDFIEMIEKVGSEAHVDLELSSIDNNDIKVKAQVTAKGGWSNILTALTLIENLPISSSIGNIKMNVSDGKDKQSRIWNLSLNIEALIIK